MQRRVVIDSTRKCWVFGQTFIFLKQVKIWWLHISAITVPYFNFYDNSNHEFLWLKARFTPSLDNLGQIQSYLCSSPKALSVWTKTSRRSHFEGKSIFFNFCLFWSSFFTCKLNLNFFHSNIDVLASTPNRTSFPTSSKAMKTTLVSLFMMIFKLWVEILVVIGI